MRDYYKILGVSPSASQQEIKKAFRKLAMQYHPDKNPGEIAKARFLDVQRAYETLSDTTQKRKYDEQRYYSGIKNDEATPVVTAFWLLGICRKLSDSLKVMDTHRMSHSALKNYILLILSDAHIAILNQEEDAGPRNEIVVIIIDATRLLEAFYLPEIFQQLALIQTTEKIQTDLDNYRLSRQKASQYDKLYPYMVLLVTLLLCMLMYWYAN